MFSKARDELAQLLPAPLLARCTELRLAKGTRLFSTGQVPHHMYFVAQGEVVLERPGLQGSSVILQRTRSGFVSEASLQSANYHCEGQVVMASDLIQVPISAIRQALDMDVAFAGRWIAMLNREVKRLRLQCERLTLNRLDERLMHLIDTEGSQGCYTVRAGLKSLAAEIGVTHEALYRCVRAMEKAGTLSRQDGQLKLHTPAAMHQA